MFNNDRINRWIEKIQGFDFSVEYDEGEKLAVPDALSRLHEKSMEEKKKQANTKIRGLEIKIGKWKKHAKVVDGITKWVHDDGRKVEVLKKEARKGLIERIHRVVHHRGVDSVYYRMKDI